MTKDEKLPFSSNCNYIELDSFGMNETNYRSFPYIADFMKLYETRKLKSLKFQIRATDWGISHPIRKELWKKCIEFHKSVKKPSTEEEYWSTIEFIFGSNDIDHLNNIEMANENLANACDDPLFYTYHLNENGIAACYRIVAAFLEIRNDVVYCPMLYPIAALLLHYMEEVDAFLCLEKLHISTVSYVIWSKASRTGVSDGLNALAKRHQRGAHNKLSKLQIEGKEEIFSDWDNWIFGHLPFYLLVRVMDCYFLEGIKILYRASITCFSYCMKDVTENTATGSALVTEGFAKAMSIFLPNIKKSPKSFLEKCFKIRKFSTKEIERVINQCIDRSMDVDTSLDNNQSDFNLFEEEQPCFSPEIEEAITRFTRTATKEQFQKLWTTLPMRVQLCSPTLIFTTEEHGSSLSTLYRLTEAYSPFLLIIKDDCGYVFGAYCSHPLTERNARDEYHMKQTFFGNGETFVFTFTPVFRSFKWVGIRMQSELPALTNVERSIQLYMHADNDEILIGGGLNEAAIQFEKDLREGFSSACPTFDSPILSSSSSFSIKVLEIYSITDK